MASIDQSSDIEVLEEEIDKVSSPETLSIWGLAWPSILANILFAAVGIVGLKAVGALGAEALAAVGTGQRIFFVIQSLIMAVSTGTTALIARAYGSGKKNEAAQVLFDSLWIGVVLGLFTTFIVWIYGEGIIGLFGLNEQSKNLAIDYLKYSMLFSAMFSASFIFGAALRAAGDAKTPLVIMIFQNVINVFLLIGLVNGSFGLPNLGVLGAALAWGISFTIGTIIFFFLWLSKLTIIPFPKFNSFSTNRIKLILKIATPATIEQGIFQLGLLIYFWIISLYGTAPIAAYNIGINILMLSFMIGPVSYTHQTLPTKRIV